ncbi:uncharacterized protein BDZ99DRAFT_480404 [Mytilinidion resinicola]|uniref:Uncharacterized protein n=1 Tax=Mytilinidion resinicola TaxID=574789 RepID=A0A6A6YA84_9PEZI|nr:uncharacterized protein BDZ99DRAFT_480404 [Mytilinidion resinicola]KAF2805732.1 hypothetical protein BDZ99DRAFT_480404 [Mytilinidion resinicola]
MSDAVVRVLEVGSQNRGAAQGFCTSDTLAPPGLRDAKTAFACVEVLTEGVEEEVAVTRLDKRCPLAAAHSRLEIGTKGAVRDGELANAGLLAGERKYRSAAVREMLLAVQAGVSAGFVGTVNPAGVEPPRVQCGQQQPRNPTGGTQTRWQVPVADELRIGRC